MHEFIEMVKQKLDSWGELSEMLLNALSLFFIVLGVIISLAKSFQYRRAYPGSHPLHTNFRMEFGGWLVVALELQLAADIVGTIVSPTTAHLIELGAIAVIRTFLNYFLNKELLEQKELSSARIKKINE
jgi:uncharacterized membrane protein